jgi:uncharacterized protein (DUF2062 family)
VKPSFEMKLKKKIEAAKADLARSIRQGVSSAEIAFALALGIFIAFVPMIGVHTVMAFLMAFLFRVNPLIVLLGTQISNPFTFPFQLFVSAQTGNLLLHGTLIRIELSGEDWVGRYLVPLLTGSLVLGVICSVLFYFGSYGILKRRAK